MKLKVIKKEKKYKSLTEAPNKSLIDPKLDQLRKKRKIEIIRIIESAKKTLEKAKLNPDADTDIITKLESRIEYLENLVDRLDNDTFNPYKKDIDQNKNSEQSNDLDSDDTEEESDLDIEEEETEEDDFNDEDEADTDDNQDDSDKLDNTDDEYDDTSNDESVKSDEKSDYTGEDGNSGSEYEENEEESDLSQQSSSDSSNNSGDLNNKDNSSEADEESDAQENQENQEEQEEDDDSVPTDSDSDESESSSSDSDEETTDENSEEEMPAEENSKDSNDLSDSDDSDAEYEDDEEDEEDEPEVSDENQENDEDQNQEEDESSSDTDDFSPDEDDEDAEDDESDNSNSSEQDEEESDDPFNSEPKIEDDKILKDPFANDQISRQLPPDLQNKINKKELEIESDLEAVTRILKGLKGKAREGARAGLIDGLKKRGYSWLIKDLLDESLILKEASNKRLDELSEQEYSDLIDSTLDLIDKLEPVSYSNDLEARISEIKADAEDAVKRRELDIEDNSYLNNERRQAVASRREKEKYNKFKSLDQFKINFYRAIRDQVEQREEDEDTWSAINRRHEDDPSVIQPGNRVEDKYVDDVPTINVYFDQSSSWTDNDIKIGSQALKVVKEFENKKEIVLNIWYFANHVHKDQISARNEITTRAWDDILNHISANRCQNVVILTDADMNLSAYASGRKVIVPGCVWYLWKNGVSAEELPKHLMGKISTGQYEFKSK